MELKEIFSADAIKAMTPAQLEVAIKTLAGLNTTAKEEPKAEVKAVEKKEPRKKWSDMDDKEKTESKKASKDKALDTPIAERMKKIATKLAEWKSSDVINNPEITKLKSDLVDKVGIAWYATYEIIKDKKAYKYITAHPVSWSEPYEEVKADLSAMGYKAKMFNYLLRYSVAYTEDKWNELVNYITEKTKDEEPIQDAMDVEDEVFAGTETETEEVDAVEEPTEEVKEEPTTTTTVKAEDNAELLSAREALADVRKKLAEAEEQLKAKRNSVSSVLNEYKYTTASK